MAVPMWPTTYGHIFLPHPYLRRRLLLKWMLPYLVQLWNIAVLLSNHILDKKSGPLRGNLMHWLVLMMGWKKSLRWKMWKFMFLAEHSRSCFVLAAKMFARFSYLLMHVFISQTSICPYPTISGRYILHASTWRTSIWGTLSLTFVGSFVSSFHHGFFP